MKILSSSLEPYTNTRIVLLPVLFLCCLLFQECSGDKLHKPDNKAIELNNLAVKLYQDDKIDSAVVLLNQAINIDSLYKAAHSNICNYLWELKKNSEALTFANHYFKIDSINGALFLGMALEKVNLLDSAKYFYNKLLTGYEKLPYNTLDYMSKVNIAVITTVTGNKEKGLKLIDDILAQNKSLSEDKLEFIKPFRNEIESYQGGGYLEFSENKTSQYWISSDKDISEIQKYLYENGINANVISKLGGYQLELKDKFRDKALKLGIVEQKER